MWKASPPPGKAFPRRLSVLLGEVPPCNGSCPVPCVTPLSGAPTRLSSRSTHTHTSPHPPCEHGGIPLGASEPGPWAAAAGLCRVSRPGKGVSSPAHMFVVQKSTARQRFQKLVEVVIALAFGHGKPSAMSWFLYARFPFCF